MSCFRNAKPSALPVVLLLALASMPLAAAAQSTDLPTSDPSTVVVQTGDVLLVDRVQQENSDALPARGTTMAQVRARYGAPAGRLAPRGGQKRAWPTINRWSYPAFTVYFEKDKVIDAVANKADPDEIGPKPPIR